MEYLCTQLAKTSYDYERKNKVKNRRVFPFDAGDNKDIASL